MVVRQISGQKGPISGEIVLGVFERAAIASAQENLIDGFVPELC